jgi:hypothetical protein
VLASGPFMEMVSELCKLVPRLTGDELFSALGSVAYKSWIIFSDELFSL